MKARLVDNARIIVEAETDREREALAAIVGPILERGPWLHSYGGIGGRVGHDYISFGWKPDFPASFHSHLRTPRRWWQIWRTR